MNTPVDPLKDPAPGVSRRSAIKMLAVGSLGAAVGVGATALVARLDRSQAPRYYFFTADEAAPLVALCEQLIPADDAPGATEAGVINYIDRQLLGPLSRHQGRYRSGLASLQRTSLRLYQTAFEKLGNAQQTVLVTLVEQGGCPGELWGEPTQKAFFNLVLDHTRQGFYGSPRHGGNRDYASYRMMGLAYPNLVGQNRYREAQG